MNRFTLSVLAANHPLYVGECCSLVVPIAQGRYGILAHHSNTLAAIVPGLLEFTLPDGSKRTATVSKGIIKIENNEVLLLVDAVESAEEPTDPLEDVYKRQPVTGDAGVAAIVVLAVVAAAGAAVIIRKRG